MTPTDDTGTAVDPDTAQAWIVDVVTRVVRTLAPHQVDRLDSAQLLVEDLGYHSLRLVELAFMLEDLFELESMTVDDALPIGTVGDVLEYVLGKVGPDHRLPTPELVETCLEDA